MRFFNIDLHIGVIGDIKQILKVLGHEVTDWTISAHAWVFGREPAKVDIVNQQTWRGIDRAMCDAFYERYRSELDEYDGFIVTHTPCFAMLYERWRKPIICVASTRYEAPFTANRQAWEDFNAYLRKQIDAGMLIPVANNKYDAAYAEYFTQRAWRVIPSLCNYTNAPYTGTLRQSLLFSKFKPAARPRYLVTKEEHFRQGLLRRAARKLGFPAGSRGYEWKDLAQFRSVVCVPYNASIMSIFEMYAAGMPMLFPSQRFAGELFAQYKQQGVFSELSYNQVYGLPPGSAIPSDSLDPNRYDDDQTMMQWIAKSDFYDPENLKHLVYFDSFEEMESLLLTLDVNETSKRMVVHHRERVNHVNAEWNSVLSSFPPAQ